MLPIAGQTAGPIGLKFLWTLIGGRGVTKDKKSDFILLIEMFILIFFHGQRRDLQLV